MNSALRVPFALSCIFLPSILHAQFINTFAGTPLVSGFSGINGPAIDIKMGNPEGVVVDNANNVYFSDAKNCVIWKVNTAGIATIFAGTGTPGDSGMADQPPPPIFRIREP